MNEPQPEPRAGIAHEAENVAPTASISEVIELLESIDEMLKNNEVVNARKRIKAAVNILRG